MILVFVEIAIPSRREYERALLLVDPDAQAVIGYITYQWPGKKITSVWTYPEYRGNGTLTQLLAEALAKYPGGWSVTNRTPMAAKTMFLLLGVAVDPGPSLEESGHTAANYQANEEYAAALGVELQEAWLAGAQTY